MMKEGMMLPLIGDMGKREDKLYKWLACPLCGKERWVRLEKYKAKNPACYKCRPKGESSYNWRGGRSKDNQGYIRVKLSPNSPFLCMADSKGYVVEHRLVMAQHLERPLEKNEIVHHADGIREHNNIENLSLGTKATHELGYKDGYEKGLKDGLELRDKSLEKQIRVLQWQVKQLSEALKLKLEI